MKSYRIWGFLIVLLFIILSILFWCLLLTSVMKGYQNKIESGERNDFVQENVGKRYYKNPEVYHQLIGGNPNPIEKEEIENDSINNRKIVNNRINIALGSKDKTIEEFAVALKKEYPSSDYEIIYMDSVINRLQLKLPREERNNFKHQVKSKMANDSLLVWEETLFTTFNYGLNDPYLNNPDYSWYLDDIQIENAWNTTYGDSNVIIAVLDNGFDLSHPELNGKQVNPYNVTSGTSDVSPSSENHGTHVAATAVAKRDNEAGLVGICPECSYMPIKIQDANGYISSSYIIDGILYAIKNGADVINISLGLDLPVLIPPSRNEQQEIINHFGKDEEQFWNELFALAEKRNAICVLAAGNNNLLTGIDPFARSNKTIKVGAFQQDGQVASFSNYGELTTVFAPGVNILSAKPGNKHEILAGTSMAAPIIAGFIGLIKSEKGVLPNQEALTIFEKNIQNVNGMPMFSVKSLN